MSEILLFYADMEAWLTEYTPQKQAMSTALANALSDTNAIEHNATSFPEVNTDTLYCHRALTHLIEAIKYAVGKGAGLYNSNLLEDGVMLAGEFPPAEITWKDIVIAWGEASDPGKMWTITTMDQLRQNMWNKPPKIKWDENPYE